MSGKQLMILEVSQKQAYIFASRKLKDNCDRSQQIADVTGEDFFKKVWPNYSQDNMVYTGGGHSVLQFEDRETAFLFARAVTYQVLKDYPGMELYVTHIPYNAQRSPQENLEELTKALEKKKARRQQSFHQILSGNASAAPMGSSLISKPPKGWSWTNDVNQISGKDGKDNFLAVVHLDGNSMGKRVQRIYEKTGSDWEECRKLLHLFSTEIITHFSEAFNDMILELTQALEKEKWADRIIPVRKLIGAGDDVCFLTRGTLGLECAASFIDHLRKKVNRADGQNYSACAGVVMIHTAAPFRQAYDLSEALCRNAKQFVAEHGGDFDALDYHIEFGQIKNALSEVQDNLKAEDGTYMTTRPFALSGPVRKERTYSHFINLVRYLQSKGNELPRSKMKTLRSAFQQGEDETKLAIRMTSTKESNTNKLLTQDGTVTVYFDDNGVRRCMYYDPIEMMDHVHAWREEVT